MKKDVIAAIAAFAMMSPTLSFAKDLTGVIKSIDKNGDTVTLANGTTVVLPEEVEAESMKVGDHVRVTYSSAKAGKVKGTSIQTAK